MARRGIVHLFAVAMLSATSAGCAEVGSQLPAVMGGIPADVPARPATPAAYPDVYDIPPARPVPPLNDAGQLKLEKELAADRASQEKLRQPNSKARADKASAASEQARDKAKAAAKPTPQ